jgi:tRNA U34 5-methylaminomethyl-2-thiouridine-forming methyltransferase MnmC
MEEIKTKDGSVTFFNEAYKDYYHSPHGAVSEAIVKFIEPCRIKELAVKNELSGNKEDSAENELFLLDICFGIGYKCCAAIDAVLEANPGCRLTIVSIEKDPQVIARIQEIVPEAGQLKNYSIIRELAENKAYNKGNINIKLIVGDAAIEINRLGSEYDAKFDAVFHDPFSPTRNQELWTKEFFSEVKKRMKKGSVLATYSCARHVRDNMKTAGFTVKDGPVFGRRGPATVAVA